MNLKKLLTTLIIALSASSLVFSNEQIQSKQMSEEEKAYSHVPVSFSFVPNIGSNGFEGNKKESNVSFNVIGGSLGTLKGVELGGIMNMEQENMYGAQMAGIVNTVNNDVKGVQYAGVVNVVKNNVTGLQHSGVANIANNNVNGVQDAGIVNIARNSLNGVQYAGISNIAGKKTNGLQMAGISNNAGQNSNVCQLAGITNIGFNLIGAQFGGITNVANGNMQGIQAAGINNFVNGDINGIQMSGIINIAKNVKGLQIGLINIADDSEGLSLGLFNYIKSVGLHYQFFVDEIGLTNFAVRSGGKKIYTLLTLGIQINNEEFAGSYGWGVGYRFKINDNFHINSDILTQALFTRDLWREDSRFIGKLRVGGNWQISKNFALLGGVSLNTYLSKVDEGKTLPSFLPNAKKDGERWHRVWPGVYMGMEF